MVLGKPKKAKPPPGDLAAVAEDGDGGAPSKKKRRAKEPDGKWAHVPSDELAAYRALFDEIDADGSGGIDRGELRKSMRKKFGMKLPEERIASPEIARAWARTVAYLKGRIQAAHVECPGRTPDLSEVGAAAMQAALDEVGKLARAAMA